MSQINLCKKKWRILVESMGGDAVAALCCVMGTLFGYKMLGK